LNGERGVRFAIIALVLLSLAGKYEDVAKDAVPLAGNAGVEADKALSLFLSEDPLSSQVIVFRMDPESSVFAVDIDEARMRAVARPERVTWPKVGGLTLVAALPSGSSADLAPIGSTAGQGGSLPEKLILEWLLRPVGREFEPYPHFEAEVVGARILDAGNREPLLQWLAPAPSPPCLASPKPGFPRCTIQGLSRSVSSVALSPTGNELLLTTGGLIPRVEVWGIDPPRRRWHLLVSPLEGGADAAGFTIDGSGFAFRDGAGRLHVLSSPSGEGHRIIESQSVAAFPVQGQVDLEASMRSQGGLIGWRLEDGTVEWAVAARKSAAPASRLDASGDGRSIAVLEYAKDGVHLEVWDIRSKRLEFETRLDSLSITGLALDYGGKRLFVSDEKEGLETFVLGNAGAGSGPEPRRITACRYLLKWVGGSDGALLCASEASLFLLDPGTGNEIESLILPKPASAAAIRADVLPDAGLAAAVSGGTLYLWKLGRKPKSDEQSKNEVKK